MEEETKNAKDEQLKRYKQTVADIRYIYRTYKRAHPDEAWETIRKLVNDPKLHLRTIKGQYASPDNES